MNIRALFEMQCPVRERSRNKCQQEQTNLLLFNVVIKNLHADKEYFKMCLRYKMSFSSTGKKKTTTAAWGYANSLM